MSTHGHDPRQDRPNEGIHDEGIHDEKAPPEGVPRQFGRYRILELLGQGGMGRVYLAMDSILQRHVALKIPVLKNSDSKVIERFYREARAMASVHHPNVCPVFDVGEFQGHHFFTMACLDGHPLSRLMRHGVPTPEREAAAIIRQLALAVDHLHESDIVHRDLKPSNVMITPNGQPIVMDFGLALSTAIDDSLIDSTATIQGSPAYMSPEQAAGRSSDVSPATDVYSLGVMLYELLTGRRPFEGPLMSVMMQIIECEPPPLNSDQQRVSDELEKICLKAISKSPTDRQATAGLLAIDLERFLKHRSGRDAPSTPAAQSPAESVTVTAPPHRDGIPQSPENADSDELRSLAIDYLAASQSQISPLRHQSTFSTSVTRSLSPVRASGRRPAVSAFRGTALLAGVVLLALAAYTGIHRLWLTAPENSSRDPAGRAHPDTATMLRETPTASRLTSTSQTAPPVNALPGHLPELTTAPSSSPGILLPPRPVATVRSTAEFSDGSDSFGNAGASLVALADVDSDGDLDAYLGYPVGTSDEIWLNDGSGTFQDSGQQLDSGDCMNGTFGDVDGDGDFDLLISAVADTGANLRLLLNDGDGRFTETRHQLPFRTVPIQSHVLADLDTDGDLDVLIYGGSRAHIWRNDGSGRMYQAGGLMTLNVRQIASVTVGDVNQDGLPDLYCSCFPSGPDHLWLGHGDCAFVDSGERAGIRGTYSAVLADIDGDGDLDGFGVPLAGSPHFMWNDGSSRLGVATARWVMLYSQWCDAVDLDGDQDLDMVFSGNVGTSFVLKNEGQFADSPAAVNLTGYLHPLGDRDCRHLACGDVDGDGDVDILRVTSHDRPVRIHFNQNTAPSEEPDGHLFLSKAVDLNADTSRCIIPGDFDADGDIDLLQTPSGGLSATVWSNNGDGQLLATDRFETSRVACGILFDADGDGDQDIATCCLTDPGQLLRNDGSGHFTVENFPAIPENSTWAVLIAPQAGFRPGLLVSGMKRPWCFRPQDERGNFPLRWEAQRVSFISRMAAGDFNGDGQEDIAVSFSAEKVCRIYLRNPAAQPDEAPFAEGVQLPLDGRHFLTPLPGDVDGDGDLDLWIAGRTDRLFLNDGEGNFTASPQVLDLLESSFGVMSDLDRDGDLDVIVANRFGNPDSIWLNDSTGQFHHHRNLPKAASSTGLAIADLNADGYPEIIVAAEPPGPSHVWFHTGSGVTRTSGVTATLPERAASDRAVHPGGKSGPVP